MGCQAGKCVCDHGRFGTQCQHKCPAFGVCPPGTAAVVGSSTSAGAYPQPRQWHSLVPVFRDAHAIEVISSSISVTQVEQNSEALFSPAKLVECRNEGPDIDCNIQHLTNCCVGSSISTVESPSPHNLPDEFTHLQL